MNPFGPRTVANTPELQRVLGLPRRELTDAYMGAFVAEWSHVLSTPLGRSEGARLNMAQATCLAEAHEVRGLYAMLSVGQGKSLLTWTLPTVLDARRPVLIINGGLVHEMAKEWRKYARHWVAPRPPPQMISYQSLDSEDKLTLLERIDPDLVLLDESHKSKRPSRTATKRLARFFEAKRQAVLMGRAPWVSCCAFTGTPGRLSILDFAHHLIWALPFLAPVPRYRRELEVWAAAIDEKATRVGGMRPGVGALRELGGEGETLEKAARNGFKKRLISTPGVVFVDKDSCDQPLTIEQVLAPPCPKLDECFEHFRKYAETPGGDPITDPLEEFRLEVDLSLGLYRIFDPPLPVPWRVARKGWADDCRAIIKETEHSGRPLDTPAAVASAYPSLESLVAWKRIEPTHTPNPKPIWCSASVVNFVAQWAKEHPGALIYSWNIPFCAALEKCTGLTWYQQGGRDRRDRYIGDAPAGVSAIVSGGANIEGRNLQYRFHECMAVGFPQSGQWLEQFFGRFHRQGQDKPVRIYALITSGGMADGFEKAIREALFAKETWGVTQKLMRAKIERVNVPVGYRFSRRVNDVTQAEIDQALEAT